MLPTHPVEELLWDIDQSWGADGPGRIPLRIVGSSALFLQTDYRRGTKDSDVLETAELTRPMQLKLIAVAGKGTSLHRKHQMYVEILASAFPFLPVDPSPRWSASEWTPERTTCLGQPGGAATG